MIEGRRYPRILVVTISTGRRKLLLQVIRIHCLVVIIGVAAGTGVRRIIIVALMAIIACNTRMCTHDRVE